MKGVKLAENIRNFAKLNPWEMHKRMGKKTVQAYLSLERKAQRITAKDLVLLEKIYIDAGGTHGAFWDLVKKDAAKSK